MQFLTKKNIDLSLDNENLIEIIGNDTHNLDQAESIALEDIKDYLRKSYDIDFELRPYVNASTSGEAYEVNQRVKYDDDTIKVWNGTEYINDDRNVSLIQICIDLFKLTIFQRLAPRQMSEQVINSHSRSIDKLNSASRGKIQMNLKTNDTEFNNSNNNSAFRFGFSDYANRNRY